MSESESGFKIKTGKLSKKTEDLPKTTEGKIDIKARHAELGFGEAPAFNVGPGPGVDIDDVLKKELKEQEFAYKFISLKKWKEDGYHKTGWKPYARLTKPKYGARFNIDAQGYTVYKDLVLAVMPETHAKSYKAAVHRQAQTFSNPNKLKAEEFKEYAREHKTITRVDDSFEE